MGRSSNLKVGNHHNSLNSSNEVLDVEGMSLAIPEFSIATVEELSDGVVRVRGNVGIATMDELFRVLLIFTALAAILAGILSPGVLITKIGIFAGVLAFFLAFTFFVRYIFTPTVLLVFNALSSSFSTLFQLSSSSFRVRSWNDFTYDGEEVVMGKLRINASDITHVRQVSQEMFEEDDWHYASILNSNGTEIGKVRVAKEDLEPMVRYLSELFQIP